MGEIDGDGKHNREMDEFLASDAAEQVRATDRSVADGVGRHGFQPMSNTTPDCYACRVCSCVASADVHNVVEPVDNENQTSQLSTDELERQSVECGATPRPWRVARDTVGSTHFKILSNELARAVQRWVAKDAEKRTGKGFAGFATTICAIAPSFNGSGKDSGPDRLIDLAEMRANAELIVAAVNSYSPAREQLIESLVEALQEVLNSGVEFDDKRMNYVVMQVDRDTLKQARESLTAYATYKEAK